MWVGKPRIRSRGREVCEGIVITISLRSCKWARSGTQP
jgi:hypothetical protein